MVHLTVRCRYLQGWVSSPTMGCVSPTHTFWKLIIDKQYEIRKPSLTLFFILT